MKDKNDKFGGIRIIGKYDICIPLTKIKSNPQNAKLYGELSKDRTYIESLKQELIEKGLILIPDVFIDTDVLDDGHNRVIALAELGATEIPVTRSIIMPTSELELMERIQSRNMRKVQSVTEKYKSVVALRDARIKERGSCEDKYMKNYCTKAQTTFSTYTKLNELLLYNRQDLFDRIDSDENSLSVSVAHSIMLQDEKKPIAVAAQPHLDTLITGSHINKTMISVRAAMNSHYNVKTVVNGVEHTFVPTFQENILSGMLHEHFANSLTQVLVDDTNVDCHAPRNHTPYDLIIPNYNWKPDVKVAKWNGRDTSKIKWTSSKQQSGYYFLIASNRTVDRFYVGYGFINGDDWKRAGKFTTYDLEKLSTSKLTHFMGEVKSDGSITTIYLDKITT